MKNICKSGNPWDSACGGGTLNVRCALRRFRRLLPPLVAALIGSTAAASVTPAPHSLPAQPLAFEPNQGQTADHVAYLARGKGYMLFLEPTESVLSLNSTRHVLRMRLLHAAGSARMHGDSALPGRHNYYIGNDPKRWHTGIPTYGQVISAGVYPGIDMIYRGDEGRMEYDFRLAPHADPRAIRLAFTGNDGMKLDDQGNLILKVGSEQVMHRAPYAYQTLNGNKVSVEAHYAVKGKSVSFALGRYDASKPLIIDPALIYASYLGGTGDDEARAVAVDSSGNIYLTGVTASNDFPGRGSSQPAGGTSDAFVTMLNSSGAVVFSTYLGSGGTIDSGASSPERGNAIAVSNNKIYVTGGTSSQVTNGKTFPTNGTRTPYQSCGFNTGYVFVSILNNNDGSLDYSTCVGVGLYQEGTGITVDDTGDAYVVGWTTASNFPTTPGAAQTAKNTNSNIRDSFFFKLDPAAGTGGLLYSTYLGCDLGASSICGSTYATAVAVDSSHYAYVAGWTGTKETDFPAGFPTANGYQKTLKGTQDAFFYKINPAGNGMSDFLFGTYLGGTDASSGTVVDKATGIAIVPSGSNIDIYVTGQTTSSDFPTFNAYNATYGGGTTLGDAFVAKFSPATAGGNNYTSSYSTYLGGSGDDAANAIAVNSTSGRAYVTGLTSSTNFPTASASGMYSTSGGNADAFVTAFDASGKTLHYSTYLGGTGGEEGLGIAVTQDTAEKVYVVGGTSSTDFRGVTADAAQKTNQSAAGGGTDAFIAVIGTVADVGVTLTATNPAPSLLGTMTYTVTVTNHGPDKATGVTLTLGLSSASSPTPYSNISYDSNLCTKDTAENFTCNLPSMVSGNTTTLSFSGELTDAGTVTASAAVSATEKDTDATNNTATWTSKAGTTTTPPPVNVPGGGSGSSGGGGGTFDPWTLLAALTLVLIGTAPRPRSR